MQPLALQPITLGWLIAVLVLIITVVLLVIGQVPVTIGLLICGCALARLV